MRPISPFCQERQLSDSLSVHRSQQCYVSDRSAYASFVLEPGNSLTGMDFVCSSKRFASAISSYVTVLNKIYDLQG